MDRLAILHLPNDESIVLPDAGEEFVIWAELQFQNLVLDATKNGHRSTRLHVPENDGCVGHSLEHSAFLSCSNDVSRV